MELTILTGASRGLGLAIARQLLGPQRRLLTIARTTHAALDEAARQAGGTVEQWTLDLAHDIGVASRLELWLHEQAQRGYTQVTLINNAGVIGTVGSIDRSPAEEIAAVMRVNLEAPIALTSAFLRATAGWQAERRVLLISSGAGRRPIAGWSTYCASKAGLDHFARVAALDESTRPGAANNGAKIVSLAPGVIDTEMQGQLRAADPAGFPDKAMFVSLHEKQQLQTPEAAAKLVLGYLARPDFGKNPVADVRDA